MAARDHALPGGAHPPVHAVANPAKKPKSRGSGSGKGRGGGGKGVVRGALANLNAQIAAGADVAREFNRQAEQPAAKVAVGARPVDQTLDVPIDAAVVQHAVQDKVPPAPELIPAGTPAGPPASRDEGAGVTAMDSGVKIPAASAAGRTTVQGDLAGELKRAAGQLRASALPLTADAAEKYVRAPEIGLSGVISEVAVRDVVASNAGQLDGLTRCRRHLLAVGVACLLLAVAGYGMATWQRRDQGLMCAVMRWVPASGCRFPALDGGCTMLQWANDVVVRSGQQMMVAGASNYARLMGWGDCSPYDGVVPAVVATGCSLLAVAMFLMSRPRRDVWSTRLGVLMKQSALHPTVEACKRLGCTYIPGRFVDGTMLTDGGFLIGNRLFLGRTDVRPMLARNIVHVVDGVLARVEWVLGGRVHVRHVAVDALMAASSATAKYAAHIVEEQQIANLVSSAMLVSNVPAVVAASVTRATIEAARAMLLLRGF